MYGLLEGVLYHAILSYDIVWCDPLVIWLLFLGIQVIYFGYADLSVAPPKFDVVVRTAIIKSTAENQQVVFWKTS
jgi:hypothetical protein